MVRKTGFVGLGAAVLLAASVIARQAGREEEPSAQKKRTETEAGSAGVPVLTEPDVRGAEETARPTAPSLERETGEEPGEPAARPQELGFWDDVEALLAARVSADPTKHREAVVARTAAYLGLEGSARTAFSGLASSVADEIDRAWAVREQLVLTLPPDREDEEQTIQEAYEGSKRLALARLESILQATAEHQEFRARLEEWIDAVR